MLFSRGVPSEHFLIKDSNTPLSLRVGGYYWEAQREEEEGMEIEREKDEAERKRERHRRLRLDWPLPEPPGALLSLG